MEQAYIIPGAWLFDTKTYPDGRVEHLVPVHNTVQVKYGPLLAALSSGKNTTAITYMEIGSGDPGWDGSPPPPTPSTAQTALLAPIARVAPSSWAYVLGDNTLAADTTSTTTTIVGVTVVTPVSMVGITNGVILKVGTGGSSELVTVTAFDATTFTATFAIIHGPGSYVIVNATARVQATVTFGVGVGNGTLRELAMFGGETAIATLGTGNLVNVLRHVGIDKPTGAGDFSLTRRLIFQY